MRERKSALRFKPSQVKAIRTGWVVRLEDNRARQKVFRGTVRVEGRDIRYRISPAEKKLIDKVLTRHHGAWDRLSKK